MKSYELTDDTEAVSFANVVAEALVDEKTNCRRTFQSSLKIGLSPDVVGPTRIQAQRNGL
jgi:hypothetical protein